VSSGQRIAILLVAAVVLIGGFVLAGSAGDDDDSDRETQTAAQPAQTESGGTADTDTGTATEPAATTEAAPPPPRVETIRMRGRAPVGEPQTLEYESGDTIRLRFRSDVAEEVHIHGYDKYVDVPANGSARTRFKADLEGIFEVESHGSGEILAKLEIRP
jgi:hypothetical protein